MRFIFGRCHTLSPFFRAGTGFRQLTGPARSASPFVGDSNDSKYAAESATSASGLRMFMRYGEKIPQAHDLTSLRLIACAGEPLNPEAWRWAQTYLAGDGKWGYVVDNWWQTELGGPALGTPATLPMRPGKAGLPLPGCDADVVDIDGKSVAPGVSGRLIQ